MKTTGVAVIGSGGIGTLRAHSCTQIPQVDYLAVCDTKQEKLGDLAAATNADMRTSDYEEAIRDDRVGAVFVSTDEENHHGVRLRAHPSRCAFGSEGALGPEQVHRIILGAVHGPG